jgi:hypothetical protein
MGSSLIQTRVALELVGDFGRAARAADHIAARDVDLIGEGQGHGLAGNGQRQIAVGGDDAGDAALAPRGLRADAVARFDRAAGDGAGEAAEVEVGAIDPLHRQAESAGLLPFLVDFDRFEVAHQRWSVVPRRALAVADHVVALERRQGDRRDVIEADLFAELAVLVDDPAKDTLRVIHQIHLVDRQHDLADADQADEIAVAPGLREDSLAGVDQDHREVGGGRAGDHVARVLLVPRRVGNDELAPVGAEEAVSDVDRDALLALGGEAVDQQREVDLAALGSPLPAVGLDGGELVFEEHSGFIEQAADQRALAVVDTAAGDEAQQALVLVLLEVGLDVAADEVGSVRHVSAPAGSVRCCTGSRREGGG